MLGVEKVEENVRSTASKRVVREVEGGAGMGSRRAVRAKDSSSSSRLSKLVDGLSGESSPASSGITAIVGSLSSGS